MTRNIRFTAFVIACVLAIAMCDALFASESVVTFKDRAADLGLKLGGGEACWFDFDNDGWVDLNEGGVLWKNNAGKGFAEVIRTGTGVAADFDGDGFADLFFYSPIAMSRSLAGKGFAEVKLPELPACSSRGACWGDFNGDGFVDVYIGGYEVWEPQTTYPDLVLLNDKGKGFKLAWQDGRYRARGVTACDFDRDGDLDVYISNYRLQPNVLWLNDGTGVFRDASAEYNAVATSAGFGGGHAIGAAWADFDNDGHIDLFAGNFAHVDGRGDQPKSRFLRNLGPEKGHKFDDLGTCGVFYQESYASPAAGDYDNDGDMDLFFTTVYGTASFGRPNNAVLFRNDGNFTFTDVTAAAGVAGLGPTYGAAWADYDNDGDLDLISAGKLFENQGNENRWLKVRLQGDGVKVNGSAIGAQVRIKLGDKTLTRQVEAGTGEGNQNDLTLHFGLGKHEAPVNLEIFWPDGSTQAVTYVETNRLVSVSFGKPG